MRPPSCFVTPSTMQEDSLPHTRAFAIYRPSILDLPPSTTVGNKSLFFLQIAPSVAFHYRDTKLTKTAFAFHDHRIHVTRLLLLFPLPTRHQHKQGGSGQFLGVEMTECPLVRWQGGRTNKQIPCRTSSSRQRPNS